MNGYDLHPQVIVDLTEIWEFIAADSISAADKVNEEILDAVAALVPFPHQGHRRPDLTSRPLRFIRVYDYLIGYAPDDQPLWVVRCFTAIAALASWPRFSGAGKINQANPFRSALTRIPRGA